MKHQTWLEICAPSLLHTYEKNAFQILSESISLLIPAIDFNNSAAAAGATVNVFALWKNIAAGLSLL